MLHAFVTANRAEIITSVVANIHVVNRAGSGCVFSLDLPRHGQRSPA